MSQSMAVLKQPAQLNGDSSRQQQLVICKVGEGLYGLEIQGVREINRVSAITPIPNASMYVLGIINLRGAIVPVIDLGHKFGQMRTEQSNGTRIVVIEIDGNLLGLMVSEVSEVLSLAAENIESTKGIISNEIVGNYVSGIGKVEDKLILILAIARLFNNSGLTSLNERVEA